MQNTVETTIEQNGVTMSMTFDEKADTIIKFTQKSVVNLTEYTDEEIAEVNIMLEVANEIYRFMQN